MAAKPVADVTLLLEGTYPYVLGGVSAWVDQIIRGLPDVTFAIFYIGSRRDGATQRHYVLPPNVLTIEEVFVHDKLTPEELKPAKTPKHLRDQIYETLAKFYLAANIDERAALFWEVTKALDAAEGQFTFGNLAHDPESWEIMQAAYEKFSPDESFIDYFWTVRFLHLPIWVIWKSRDLVPSGRVYHTVSTGYAGLAGAIASRNRDAAFIITEHGIYTKERIAEISQAEWIYEGEIDQIELAGGLGKLKQAWIDKFTLLGQIAYNAANLILTLFEGNLYTQIEFGADRNKIRIIPNGIDPSKFERIRDEVRARWNPTPSIKTIGFVGRVVPIKDVKTLIRAARLVCEKRSDVRFLIIGPNDEDPAYFEDCEKSVTLLGLQEKVRFLGKQKLMDILPSLDVMVLTSISEGLPLVVLEAMAAAIPVVASDVGACRELVFGRTPEDKALGRCGRVTKILSPQETAAALLSVLENPTAWAQMGESGRRRTEEYYSMDKLIESYRDMYTRLAVATAFVEVLGSESVRGDQSDPDGDLSSDDSESTSKKEKREWLV